MLFFIKDYVSDLVAFLVFICVQMGCLCGQVSTEWLAKCQQQRVSLQPIPRPSVKPQDLMYLRYKSRPMRFKETSVEKQRMAKQEFKELETHTTVPLNAC